MGYKNLKVADLTKKLGWQNDKGSSKLFNRIPIGVRRL